MLLLTRVLRRTFTTTRENPTRINRHVYPYLRDLYKRRLQAGPEPERPRRIWSTWDYDAELFSFGKRLNEEFKSELLQLAFVHPSFPQPVTEKQNEINRTASDSQESDSKQQTPNNEMLVSIGRKLAEKYTGAFLRTVYPHLPEELVQQVMARLLSIEQLATVGAHLGVKDLIYSQDFPPHLETTANTLLAVIGALHGSQGEQRVFLFIRDFILTQLANQDVNSLYHIHDPIHVMNSLMKKLGLPTPESRVIQQSSVHTILACYHVGIYVNQKLFARSAGESLQIAEEEAAREALKVLFKTTDARAPIQFLKIERVEQLNGADSNLSLQKYGVSNNMLLG